MRKMQRFPNVADFQKGLKMYDEINKIAWKKWLADLKNIYVLASDLILKNLDSLDSLQLKRKKRRRSN